MSSNRPFSLLHAGSLLGGSAIAFLGMFHLRHAKNLKMMIPVLEGSVIDVGCGDGESSALFVKHSDKIDSIYGIDPHLPEEVAVPARSYDGVTIPFPDESFDVALASFILHHAQDAEVVIREMKRVGRRVVVAEDYVDTWGAWLAAVFMHELMRFVLNMEYEKDGFRTMEQWRAIFDKNGLEIVAEKEYSSMVLFFPFLRHSLFVLADKNDAEAKAKPVQFYDPKLDFIDIFNWVFMAGGLYLLQKGVLGAVFGEKKV